MLFGTSAGSEGSKPLEVQYEASWSGRSSNGNRPTMSSYLCVKLSRGKHKKYVQKCSKVIYIHRFGVRLPVSDLRRAEAGVPDGRQLCRPVGDLLPRNAKVNDQRPALFVEQHVVRGQVSAIE